MPPGSTIMSKSRPITASSVVSDVSTVPREPVSKPAFRPATVTSISARGSISMTATASSSSKPSASGINTLGMISLSAPCGSSGGKPTAFMTHYDE